MKRKTLLIATFLVASLAIGSSAQAHDDFAYPAGLLSGVILGLSLDHHDHYYYDRDRPYRHYRHREYRRQDSHGYQYRDHYKHNHGHDKRDRGYRRHDRY
jgi:hypothetical protein